MSRRRDIIFGVTKNNIILVQFLMGNIRKIKVPDNQLKIQK